MFFDFALTKWGGMQFHSSAPVSSLRLIHPGFIAVVCVNEIAFGLTRLSCGVITPQRWFYSGMRENQLPNGIRSNRNWWHSSERLRTVESWLVSQVELQTRNAFFRKSEKKDKDLLGAAAGVRRISNGWLCIYPLEVSTTLLVMTRWMKWIPFDFDGTHTVMHMDNNQVKQHDVHLPALSRFSMFFCGNRSPTKTTNLQLS